MARVTEIPVRIGDTLPSLAQRVLGDGLRWRELVTLNNLKPPFLVSSLDPLDRLPDTMLWGDWIKVPAQAINASGVVKHGWHTPLGRKRQNQAQGGSRIGRKHAYYVISSRHAQKQAH